MNKVDDIKKRDHRDNAKTAKAEEKKTKKRNTMQYLKGHIETKIRLQSEVENILDTYPPVNLQ